MVVGWGTDLREPQNGQAWSGVVACEAEGEASDGCRVSSLGV